MIKVSKPLVSIITLNWNGTLHTREFLRSITKHNSYENIEVIVVDNASAEDPTLELLSTFPSARIIRNKKNLGFSAGNNVGILAAKGDYFFIVNNDTEFTPGLLEGLLAVFEKHPETGIACPKFHYFFNKGTIEYAGYNAVNIFTGRNSMVGSLEKDKGQYNILTETNYAHGGGMMVSRKVIQEVGLMPEQFFLYYEELDWSEQIKRKGFKIFYQPDALIYHKESMSTGKMSPLKTFYLTRNRILFMRRNTPLPGLGIFILYFTFFTIPKNTLQYILKKQIAHLKSFWKGIFWHFNSKITV
ncbi:MAG TPA: glycosyltransferase family 2 protein [Flavisolibacter sp.]|nr:glycosyltransferase family 2 protein [Flavisolibacter sp.]